MPISKKKPAAKKSAKKPFAKKTSVAARKKPAGKVSAKKGRSLGSKKKQPTKKPKVAPKTPSTSRVKENPEAKALALRIGHLLLEKKASRVVVLDVRGKTSYADYLVVASGDSDTQISAMADHVETSLKHEGGHRTVGSEGQQGGNWVLLDYGDVVAHLFLEETRAFYDLEGIWADAPKENLA